MKRSPKQQRKISSSAIAVLALLCSACAANPIPAPQPSPTAETPSQKAQETADATQSVRVRFHYSDFYSLLSPKAETSCAGDLKTLYDGFAMTSTNAGYTPTTLPADPFESSATVHPSFVKNISVDLTDANSPVALNLAKGCSYGSTTGAPPASNCATFDYGAIGGIPSTMGGSLLLIGGLMGANKGALSGYNGRVVNCGTAAAGGISLCDQSAFALGVETLPASSATDPVNALVPALTSANGPISSWADLASGYTYTGPYALAGAASGYSPGVNKVLVVSGSTLFSSPRAAGAAAFTGRSSSDTWTLDLKTQTWSMINNFALDSKLVTIPDKADPTQLSSTYLPKTVGGRALFGYSAAQGFALSRMSTNGVVAPGNIDLTDRVMIVGGNSASGFFSDTHKFNPTYGPEYVDSWKKEAKSGSTISVVPADANDVVQWLDSFHTQLVSNDSSKSKSTPDFPPYSTDSTTPSVSLAANFSTTTLLNGATGAGYVLTLGGFDSAIMTNNPAGTGCDPGFQTCGAMQITARNARDETAVSGFSATPDRAPPVVGNDSANGVRSTPVEWATFTEGTLGSLQTVPWYGGGTALPGFNLKLNDVVFFGGTTCQDYLTNASATCDWNNAGRYWRFTSSPVPPLPITHAGNTTNGSNQLTVDANAGIANGQSITGAGIPTGTTVTSFVGTTVTMSKNASATAAGITVNFSSPNVPSPIAMAGTIPKAAGTAAARGFDAAGKIIIVAWGGAVAATSPANAIDLYYLYDANGDLNNPNPTWVKVDVSATQPINQIPASYANASMVFSHVTGKFYMFGGYKPNSSGAGVWSADTWELTVKSNGLACTPGNGCTFAWRKLNDSSNPNFSCYPTTCPSARHSHRMVEVNYYNRNPGGASGTADGESLCNSAGAPCSYGIFMEGGVAQSSGQILSDRWMFDPTANGGAGQWQKMSEFPPRTLPAMSTIDYTPGAASSTLHRAILFGGETGLTNPQASPRISNFFVAPTLGDTLMFDFDTNTWNRVTLLGKGYNTATHASAQTAAGDNVFEKLQAYSAQGSGDIAELTPPPLSGAIMVTRTMPQALSDSGTTVQPLTIPEVYLFGGRQKDGTYLPLDRVYKFCAGSPGESATGVCDDVTGISAPVGRWLRKRPPNNSPTGLNDQLGIDPTRYGVFLGAGTYDSVRDRIVLIGAQSLSGSGSVLDDAAGSPPSSNLDVFEYAAPTKPWPGDNPTDPKGENGYWKAVPPCSGLSVTPTFRLGATVNYDPLNRRIIVVGGMTPSGTAKTQSVSSTYDTYTIPEVWTGTRVTGTDECYQWSQVDLFGNLPNQTFRTQEGSTWGLSSGLTHASSVYIPSSGYNSGYYTMMDNACSQAGPIASEDPAINKLLAGGAYFEIDRSALGPNENLLLNLTFIPLGPANRRPDSNQLSQTEEAVFRVHLIKTDKTGDLLRQIFQPRYLSFTASDEYPTIAQTISVLSPPSGEPRTEQIVIPLSADPQIDRIRIERYSGSGILIDAGLYRMGYR